MITLVGLLASLTLLPYAIYRIVHGNYLVAFVDFLMISTSLLAVLIAWSSGKTDKAGLLMAVVFCIGAAIVVFKLGAAALFWLYPLMVFLFFLVAPLNALILLLSLLSVVLLLYVAGQKQIFSDHIQLVAFIATSVITSVFAYIFAYRANIQRKELRRLASTDPLTGAYNRHQLSSQLQAIVQSHQQIGTDSGLMLLDLDHFKSINDRHGHQAGDNILIVLVQQLQQHLGQQADIYRYGGEEFLIVVCGAEPEQLGALAEDLRLLIHHHIKLPDGQPITASFGIANASQANDWTHWLHLADKALYKAKHLGRNRVEKANLVAIST